jgi:hypothetical protein
MTTVLAGGDSFIFGSELLDSPDGQQTSYSRRTFPALLANHYVCAAYPGLGNREIAYRVRDALEVVDPDIVVVLWTWPSRDNQLDSDHHIRGLQAHLEYESIPYMFTCADNCVVTGRLDYDNWYMFPAGTELWETTAPRGFYQWAIENKYAVGPQHHPLEQAHLDASKLMQEKFNELVTKSIQ